MKKIKKIMFQKSNSNKIKQQHKLTYINFV